MIYKALVLSTFLVLLVLRYVGFSLLRPQIYDGMRVDFTTRLLDDAQYQWGKQKVSVWYGNFWGKVPATVLISGSQPLVYGQVVHVSGTLSKRLINDKKPLYSISGENVSVVQEGGALFSSMKYLRDRAFTAYFTALPQDESKLLAGIVFGKRFTFDQAFQNAMQVSGVTHVIAASGMNVTFTISFLSSIFLFLLRRRLAVYMSLCGVGYYVLLSGFSPSIVRASIMGIGTLIAQLLGRQHSGLYWLGICVYLMLTCAPELLWDVGFELSVMATLGLFVLKPLCVTKRFFDDVTTTISAQIATVPIILSTFGSIGMLSVIVNGLVLWMIAPLMTIGMISAVLSLISLPVASLFVLIAHPFLWLFRFLVLFFGSLPVQFRVESLPLAISIGYYCLIGGVVWILWQRKRESEAIL